LPGHNEGSSILSKDNGICPGERGPAFQMPNAGKKTLLARRIAEIPGDSYFEFPKYRQPLIRTLEIKGLSARQRQRVPGV
jgi:hypothetical protein